ncbi:hypothetical protein CEK62_21435 (plasmid) [Alcanivorax sp. N3-2A]|nr:hypothetical protein CEK62_01240 [Alcanivorax sp. N3-2A]ASK36919.1 hypothetical protein CEK62_21435 [Alcanivorax sp. N3-2A]|tara:strand:- start:27545 stop:28045 length:501 start_codon:yes stop_codon:yes gene_type:complete
MKPRTLLILALSLVLAACSGWQLRGDTQNPRFESVTLVGASARLRYNVERGLAPSGTLVHSQSPYIVNIIDERWNRRTAAVDERGRAAERELTYEIIWQLIDRKTNAVLNPPRHIMAIRSFAYSPDNVTATSDEEYLVEEDLFDDITYRLINQIADASRKIVPKEE